MKTLMGFSRGVGQGWDSKVPFSPRAINLWPKIIPTDILPLKHFGDASELLLRKKIDKNKPSIIAYWALLK